MVYGTGNARSRFSAGGFTLHLYCADPSGKLKDCMAGAVSTILFSATFLPIQYYKGLLGGSPEDFAKGNDLLRQVTDLALLGNGMLKGKALSDFITRSQSLLNHE